VSGKIYTVKPVLSDHPFHHQNMVFQDRWFLKSS